MVGGTGPVNWLSDRLSTFKEVICIKVSVKGPASQCTDTQDCKLELFFLKRKDGKGSYFSFLNITIAEFQTIEYYFCRRMEKPQEISRIEQQKLSLKNN
jgi:hypothetical protein